MACAKCSSDTPSALITFLTVFLHTDSSNVSQGSFRSGGALGEVLNRALSEGLMWALGGEADGGEAGGGEAWAACMQAQMALYLHST